MPSFDTVSRLETHEVDNAVQQASREVEQRYDFRGSGTEITRNDEGIHIKSDSQQKVMAALLVLNDKMTRRKVALSSLDAQTPYSTGGSTWKQLVRLKEGVDKDLGKQIVKHLKDSKLKVQASIQGDIVRVSGKKRDDLQDAIACLKARDFGQPLQYINFRD